MNSNSKSFAIISGVFIFFLMSIIGWVMGLDPATCCSRALAGSVITYIVVTLAVKAVMHIIVDQMIQTRAEKMTKQNSQQ